MSEVKPLSAEQLEDLRNPADLHDESAQKYWLLGLVELNPDDGEYERTPAGDTLLATITNERHQAAEGERRRIDGLANQYGSLWASRATDGSGWIVEKHEGDSANMDKERPTFTGALEAAANSLNKEQTTNER